MIVNKEYTAICRGCLKPFSLYNYVGLHKDSLMGSHHCKEISDLISKRTRIRNLFYGLKEVKVETQT